MWRNSGMNHGIMYRSSAGYSRLYILGAAPYSILLSVAEERPVTTLFNIGVSGYASVSSLLVA